MSETETPASPEATPAVEQEAESEAREQGWRPKDEYLKLPNADPAKWVDAETFLERARTKGPLMHARNEALLAKNRKLEADVREMRDMVRDVLANQKADRERAVAAALANLKAQKKSAVAEADTARVDAIDDAIDRLKDEPKANGRAPEARAPAVPEEFVEWGRRNPWINPKSQYHDPMMAGAAIGYFDLLNADPENEDLSDADKLKKVSAEMRRRFPEKFQNPNRKAASSVEGANGSGSRGSSKRSAADLPAEAKEAGERFVRQKIFKSMQEYADKYFEQQ